MKVSAGKIAARLTPMEHAVWELLPATRRARRAGKTRGTATGCRAVMLETRTEARMQLTD